MSSHLKQIKQNSNKLCGELKASARECLFPIALFGVVFVIVVIVRIEDEPHIHQLKLELQFICHENRTKPPARQLNISKFKYLKYT